MVEAHQARHRQVVGPGDLAQGLALPDGVLAGTGNNFDRFLFRLGHREHGVRRQLQRFTKLHMIGIAEAVQGDQIARTDLIPHRDLTERLPFTHPVTPRPGRG